MEPCSDLAIWCHQALRISGSLPINQWQWDSHPKLKKTSTLQAKETKSITLKRGNPNIQLSPEDKNVQDSLS